MAYEELADHCIELFSPLGTARARPGDAEVDAMLTDDGVVWERRDD